MEPDGDVEAIETRLLLEAIEARYGYDLREYAPTSMRRRVRAALARTGLVKPAQASQANTIRWTTRRSM